MIVNQECYGLFVDINDTLYCSITDLHQVVTKSLNSGFNTSTVVAGTGCPGYTSYTLYYPYGIFVDINFDLYVADCYNNRIQRFQSGQLSATTVAGGDVPGTFPLQCPTGIVLDADNYLYIVDSGNNRIISTGPNGFRYLVGGYSSWTPEYYNQLSYPQSMVFDRDGNLFVTDMENSRIQKFMLLENSLSKCKIDFHHISYNILHT
jgi:sugar lactone lactonase YvrE